MTPFELIAMLLGIGVLCSLVFENGAPMAATFIVSMVIFAGALAS